MSRHALMDGASWSGGELDAGIKPFAIALFKKVNGDDCQGLAAEMSYHLILSLAPLFLFLMSLAGAIGGQREVYPMIHDFIQRLAPGPSVGLLTDTMDAVINGSSTGLTALGFLGTLGSASGAAGIVVKGLQRAYGLSGRKFPLWYSPWLSLAVILSLGVLTILSIYIIMLGNFLFGLLQTRFHLSQDMASWITGLRWVVVFVAIHYGASFAYSLMMRPHTGRLPWKDSRLGSWFFVVGWIVGSWLFSLYLTKLPQFNPVYGSLGVLIILVTWFYYSAFLFFIGGEITALRVGVLQTEPVENHLPDRSEK